MDHDKWLAEHGQGSYASGAHEGTMRVDNVDWAYLPDPIIPAPELKVYDEVERPEHYNLGEIECIDGIKASMPKEEYEGYLKGNVIKYLWRYRYKGNPVQDLEKAQWYLMRLLDSVTT